MKLIIDERIWLHGEGMDGETSSLYRPDDGKLCCLGIYGLACGIDKKQMEGVGGPGALFNWHITSTTPPLEMAWLLTDHKFDSPVGGRLMELNDDDTITDEERKTRIKKIFAEHGVEVEFVNGDVLQEAKGVLDEATKHHLDQTEIGTVQAQICQV